MNLSPVRRSFRRAPLGGHLKAIVAVLATLSACTTPEQELSWVRGADAAQMLAESMGTGRVEFLSVCGITCETPGLKFLTYAHCYRGAAPVRVIDPTGDVIRSDAHLALKDEAARLAEEYNRLLKAALDSAGKRSCGLAERWDDLWAAMHTIANEGPERQYVTSIIAAGEPQSADYDFHLHVPDSVNLTPGLSERLCALVPDFGIRRVVRFQVSTGNINAHPVNRPRFTCVSGRVAA